MTTRKLVYAPVILVSLLMVILLSMGLTPVLALDRTPPDPQALTAVGPTLATLDNGVIHAEIGTNFAGQGPGIIHLWNKALYPATTPDNPHDVMWYGQYDYVSIDGTWQAAETGGVVNQISPTHVTVTWTHAGAYTLVKDLETVPGRPAIKITITLTNNHNVAHSYDFYTADDLTRQNNPLENLYLFLSTTPLAKSQFIPSSVSRAIIIEMDVSPTHASVDWAVVGYCDPGQIFAGSGLGTLLRTWTLGTSIKGADDNAGILFSLGTLAPGISVYATYYIGVTDTHTGADSLVQNIISCFPKPVGGVALPTNKLEILTPYLALAGLVIAVSAVVVVKRRTEA